MYGKQIRSVWYFRETSDQFIAALSLHLHTEVYSTGEDILSDGKLFIINRGLILRHSMIKGCGTTMGDDFIFGKILRRPVKAIVLAFAELMTLTQDAYFEVLVEASEVDYRSCRRKIVRLTVIRSVITQDADE